MSILPIILSGFGGVLFLFIFWRRLREDYSSPLIFSSGSYFIVLIAACALAFHLALGHLAKNTIFDPTNLWFWGAVLGFSAALALSTRKLHLRLIETMEAGILAGGFWLLLVFAANLAFLPIVLMLLLLILFYYFEKNYKRFSWYKSGRVGFSGLLMAFIFLLFEPWHRWPWPESFQWRGG